MMWAGVDGASGADVGGFEALVVVGCAVWIVQVNAAQAETRPAAYAWLTAIYGALAGFAVGLWWRT